MAKQKILFITVRADHGGGPKHIDQLIDLLHGQFDLFLACPNNDPYFPKWQKEGKVKGLVLLPNRKFSLKAVKQVREFVKNERITLIHSHGKGAGIYSRILKALTPGIKVIHTFHGVHLFTYSRLQKALYILLEKVLKQLTYTFVNVSNGEKKICVDLGIIDPADSVVIYNGSEDLAISGKNKIYPEGFFKVVTISRFDVSKNMQLAFEIATCFKDQKDISFVWVGDGPDKNQIEELAYKKGLPITFTGFQQNVSEYLKDASLYLSTSRWEGLPISLIEATSLGIPIVATDVTGNNEVVTHGKNGFLFDLSRMQQAVSFINRIKQEPMLYKEMADQARISYETLFHLKHMERAYQELYQAGS